jgi:DNA repair ATPase RecN
MTVGLHLSEVRFRGGPGVEDAVVTFGQGLSVVAGPSNTGKSLLRSAINFVFGSGDPMKSVAEAGPYRSIFVEIKTAAGRTATFERAWNGGDIRQYTVAARDVRHNTPSIILAWKHSAENQRNISNVLLTLSGLAGTKILRSKSSGETRNLSFRDLVEYLLISGSAAKQIPGASRHTR